MNSHQFPPLCIPHVSMCLVAEQRSKRNIIGYFEKKDSDDYHTYEKVANILRDDCTFLATFG